MLNLYLVRTFGRSFIGSLRHFVDVELLQRSREREKPERIGLNAKNVSKQCFAFE